MTAFANVVLTDSASANRTFVPASIDQNGVARWFETASVLDARLGVSLSTRLPTKGGNVARVTGKLVIPVMDTVDTSLKVGEIIGTFEFVIPKRATTTQKHDARSLMYAFIGDANVLAAVRDQLSVY